MKRMLSSMGIFLLGLGVIVVLACGEKTPTGQSAAPQSQESQVAQQAAQPPAGPSAPSASQEMELVGTLARSGDGFTIITDSGDYSIAAQPLAQNLDEWVDRQVKVTATLVEGAERQDGTHVIEVIRLSGIEE